MNTAAKHHTNNQPSSSKPPKNPTTSAITTATATTQTSNSPQNSKPKPIPVPTTSSSPITLSLQDQVLSRATHFTSQELLKRRSHNLKQLSRCYRDHYWAVMEELKNQYREYYWKYGVSPFKEDQPQLQPQLDPNEAAAGAGASGLVYRESGEREAGNAGIEVIGESNNANGNSISNNHSCLFVACKLKAMALTSFCHLHILSDAKQKLYKPCAYVIKSAQAGPITCGKPILRSTAPSFCSVHFQKAQKHVTRALKKAGLNVSSSSKLASKFHIIVAEYVREIQAKRRAAKGGNRNKGVDKQVSVS